VSQPLARVTGNLDAPRGPDVKFTVSVDRSWFGQAVLIALPRILNCARCEGGGCDECERGGALSLRQRGAKAEELRVILPSLPDPEMDVCLRIPGEGGHSTDAELGRGHLCLTVRPSEESSAEVTLDGRATSSAMDRNQLIRSSSIMAGLLVLLFLGMLRLSGWL
jgi:hypothetical protein